MGEILPFPSERNREYIRSQLNKAATLAIQIEDLQEQRNDILRSIGMLAEDHES